MTNTLIKLGSQEILGKTVTAFGTVENPLFLAKEVAGWLEHSQTDVMIRSIDNDEKIKTMVPPEQCSGGIQPNTEYWFLTENGLYEVLFLSRKPEAKKFKAGVKKLLHDLRTGKAQVICQLTGDDLILAAITELQNRITSQKQIIEKQQQQITDDAPKVKFHDTVKYSNVLCHFHGMANVLFNNGIDIGRNRLIRDFRIAGDVRQVGALFTQKALDREIGQNVQTGTFELHGAMQMSFRAFLNYKGICEVFDRYMLSDEQRVAVMQDLTAEDELPEAGF